MLVAILQEPGASSGAVGDPAGGLEVMEVAIQLQGKAWVVGAEQTFITLQGRPFLLPLWDAVLTIMGINSYCHFWEVRVAVGLVVMYTTLVAAVAEVPS